jgi:SAM-dependent methyltransferase
MEYTKYRHKLSRQKSAAVAYSGLQSYLKYLYKFFAIEIESREKILEIGSGAGTSLEFLEHPNITRTDIIESLHPKIIGNVDAQSLPFAKSEFNSVIGMDVLHHFQFPFEALCELKRVLAPGGSIILVEPYVSLLSYLPYRLFHSEQTSMFQKRGLVEPVVGPLPEDGDQTIPRLLFCTKNGARRIQDVFSDTEYRIDIRFISIISFFITGGINRPLRTPGKIVQVLIKAESLIPQKLMKLLGSRMVISIYNTASPEIQPNKN